jgi:hypothetical protein
MQEKKPRKVVKGGLKVVVLMEIFCVKKKF